MYEFSESMICEDTLKWINSQKKDCDDQMVPTCATMEWPGIYSFQFLKPEFNQMWMEEIQNFKKFCEKHKIPAQSPNTMNNFGVILDDFGFKDML